MKSPRTRSIRSKVTALLVPLRSLVALWGCAAVVTGRDALTQRRHHTLDRKFAPSGQGLLVELGRERQGSAMFLSPPRSGEDGTPAALRAQRSRVDEAVEHFRRAATADAALCSWTLSTRHAGRATELLQRENALVAGAFIGKGRMTLAEHRRFGEMVGEQRRQRTAQPLVLSVNRLVLSNPRRAKAAPGRLEAPPAAPPRPTPNPWPDDAVSPREGGRPPNPWCQRPRTETTTTTTTRTRTGSRRGRTPACPGGSGRRTWPRNDARGPRRRPGPADPRPGASHVRPRRHAR